MQYIKILLFVFILVLTSCSSTKEEDGVENSNNMDNVASNEEIDESDFIFEEEDGDEALEEVQEDVMAEAEYQNLEEEDEFLADYDEALEMEEEELLAAEDDGAPVIGAMMQYAVKKNDTLMFIAFKLYGDYGKWRKLVRANPGINSAGLREGTVINYPADGRPFVWNPKGSPYLIQDGDTLGTISHDKYGTPRRWKDIYNNNRPMIKDPNLIFAGFTLYYIPDRDIASR